MKRFTPLVVLALVVTTTCALHAKDAPAAPSRKAEKSMQVTDAEDKKTVAVPAGKAFDIVLKGNATTGFEWQVEKIDGDAVKQTGKVDYVSDKSPEDSVGVGGTFVFHFKVTEAAKTKIRLVHVRPWEKDKSRAKTFEVVIDSTPAAAAQDMLVF